MLDREDRRLGTVIVWFRRDLRVADHPALSEAVSRAQQVVPLFVLDERLLGRAGRAVAPARTSFLLHSLLSLDETLRSCGSGLLVRHGRPEDVLPAVAREVRAHAVLATRDVTAFSHRRDRIVSDALERDGRSLLLRPGLLLVEPESMLTRTGSAYSVFTPFWRFLQRSSRREVLGTPGAIATPAEVIAGSATLLRSLAGPSTPVASMPEPGEAAALHRLKAWTSDGLSRYDESRNRLGGDGTSRLGQDLHFGLLSPRQVETAVTESGMDTTAFMRQIAWREFYHHDLFHQRQHPDHGRSGRFASIFRSEQDDPLAVEAWRHGHTGIPVVDAGMRQLRLDAWLSNRARLVVASFLTRHLLLDYRIGERHFMRHLIDGDVANNRGGWRWTAGVGADPQPWFRIFNPVLQGRRFDPDGEWVRRWVPELADVPVRYLHAPWEMPTDVARRAGFEIGITYPHPIVDLRAGRERALAAFRSAIGTSDPATPTPG